MSIKLMYPGNIYDANNNDDCMLHITHNSSSTTVNGGAKYNIYNPVYPYFDKKVNFNVGSGYNYQSKENLVNSGKQFEQGAINDYAFVYKSRGKTTTTSEEGPQSFTLTNIQVPILKTSDGKLNEDKCTLTISFKFTIKCRVCSWPILEVYLSTDNNFSNNYIISRFVFGAHKTDGLTARFIKNDIDINNPSLKYNDTSFFHTMCLGYTVKPHTDNDNGKVYEAGPFDFYYKISANNITTFFRNGYSFTTTQTYNNNKIWNLNKTFNNFSFKIENRESGNYNNKKNSLFRYIYIKPPIKVTSYSGKELIELQSDIKDSYPNIYNSTIQDGTFATKTDLQMTDNSNIFKAFEFN